MGNNVFNGLYLVGDDSYSESRMCICCVACSWHLTPSCTCGTRNRWRFTEAACL